jgi:hypothetical protein
LRKPPKIAKKMRLAVLDDGVHRQEKLDSGPRIRVKFIRWMGYAAHERRELVSALGAVRRGDLIVALVGTPVSFIMRKKENG